MKTFFYSLLATAVLLTIPAKSFAAAEQTPMVTFTVEADGQTNAAFNLSSTLTDGQMVQVDWGDGVLTEPVKVVYNDGGWESTAFSAVPKGNVIKVYGDQSTIYEVDASYQKGNLLMTSADFSALTDVIKINIATNAFTSVDLSRCAALEDFRASSNKLTDINFGDISNIKRLELQNTNETVGENRLGSIDITKLTSLTYLNLNFNDIETFNFSPLEKLESLYALGNRISEVDFSSNPKIKYISLNNNPVRTIALPTEAVNKCTFLLLNTYLSFAELQKVIDYAALKSGKVTAATLTIPCEGNTNVIDLSAYYQHGETVSTFSWVDKNSQGIPTEAYTMENGVFNFTESFESAVCTVENGSFSGRKFVTLPVDIKTQAEQTPMVTFTVEADGQTNAAFNLSSTLTDGQMVQVDWGDGVLTEPVKVVYNDGGWESTAFSAVPKGNVIKVYGDQSTIYEVDASWAKDNLKMTEADLSALTSVPRMDFTSNALTTIDLSKCDGLVSFVASNNSLTEVKFGANVKLETFKIDNASATTGANDVHVLNLPELPELKDLRVSQNKNLSNIDFTKYPKLSSLYAINCHFTEADLSQCGLLKTTNFTDNPLADIKVPSTPAEGAKKYYFYLTNTYLSFEMLQNVLDYVGKIPSSRVTAATLTIPCEGNTNVIDLSAYYQHGETVSTFSWVDKKGQEIPETAYTMENGVFTFNTESYRNAVCTVENGSFSDRKFVTLPVDIKTQVEELMMTFNVAAGEQKNLSFNLCSSLEEGQMARIDWGDGVLSDPVKVIYKDADPYFTNFTAVPKGEVIKVYADQSTIYEVDASWGTGYAKITAADFSNLTDVRTITIASNAISTIDLTNCAALETFYGNGGTLTEVKFGKSPNLWKIELQNGDATTGENAIHSLDLSTLSGLKTLNLGYNGIETIDFSKSPTLESLYLLGNKFTEVDLSACKNIKLVNFNFNPVRTMTLPSEAVNKCRFHLNESYLDFNELQKVTDYAAMKAGSVNAPTLFIPCEGGGKTFDFSSYHKHGENTSVFVWRDGEGNTISEDDFTMTNGVFDFSKSFAGAVCTVTNASFSKSTFKTLPVNIVAGESGIEDVTVSDNNAPVEYFDLRGIRVAGDKPGLYIRRQGDKVEKVIVK